MPPSLSPARRRTRFSTLLEKHREFLPELFIVSDVNLTAPTAATIAIEARHARESGLPAARGGWRWVPKLSVTSHGEVCPRCEEALNS